MSAAERNARAEAIASLKAGDVVIFDGRYSHVVTPANDRGILTVSNYAGAWMIGTCHSKLEIA